MKTKRYASRKNIRARILVAGIVLAGACNSAQAQKDQATGINDALEQKTVMKRDPFWPVGYMPKNITTLIATDSPKPSMAAVENSWSEAMKRVVINGVSSSADGEYFAIINSEVKSVGDTVTVNHGGTIYTWAVDNIKPPGSVKLRRISAE